MSGSTVSRALHLRFDRIRRAELERLDKKLRGLSEADRESIEAITADIVRAIACVPEQALVVDAPHVTLDAVVRLFDLEAE